MKLQRLIPRVALSMLGIVGVIGMGFAPLASVASAATCGNNAGYGVVTFSNVTLPSTGTYYLWSRINVPVSGNGYQLEVNGSACFQTTTTTTGSWVWSGGTPASKATFTFSSASGNTIKLIGLNANVKVDRISLCSNASVVPTGTGDGCTTATGGTTTGAPPTTTGASGTLAPPPTATQQVGGKVNPSQDLSITDASQIASVTYYVDGKKVQTSKGAVPLDTTRLTNGIHKVETQITYIDGSSTSELSTINVFNKQTAFTPTVRWVRNNQRLLSVGGGTLGTAVLLGGGFVVARHLYLQRRLMHFHGF